ncbi:hypothetical protein HZH68_007383 [Vespula germanica]|uniref:Uncharacterized protein n=1 Tax=Vespula germanica TaxID=30212 RepID=A0A834K7K4_VESGE|nr:hypothetical protein HZH68_007383 [Vespula germanica]
MTFFWTSCVVGSSWLAVDCPLPLSFAWDSLAVKTGKDMEIWADRNDREMILRGRREHPAKGSANFHFDVCADESPILRSPTFPPPVTTTTSFQAPRREGRGGGSVGGGGGGDAGGVRRVQPVPSEPGLVSLVTAPHKGIAL